MSQSATASVSRSQPASTTRALLLCGLVAAPLPVAMTLYASSIGQRVTGWRY